jgi:hypothetical protein
MDGQLRHSEKGIIESEENLVGGTILGANANPT